MIDETEAPGAKSNGAAEEIDEGYFTQETRTPTRAVELDLDEYRSGRPLDLAEIISLPPTQKIETRRPKKKEWFRCWSTEVVERVYLYEGDGIDDFYLVHRAVATELPDEFSEFYLVLCINSSGRLFVWPIKIGDTTKEFTEMALSHAGQANLQWVRRRWIRRLNTHQIELNTLAGVQPEWPKELSMKEILSRAFADKVIKSLDHPSLQFIVKGK